MELTHIQIIWISGSSGTFARRSTRIRCKPRALGMCCSGVGSVMKLESDIGIGGSVHGFVKPLLDNSEKGHKGIEILLSQTGLGRRSDGIK